MSGVCGSMLFYSGTRGMRACSVIGTTAIVPLGLGYLLISTLGLLISLNREKLLHFVSSGGLLAAFLAMQSVAYAPSLCPSLLFSSLASVLFVVPEQCYECSTHCSAFFLVFLLVPFSRTDVALVISFVCIFLLWNTSLRKTPCLVYILSSLWLFDWQPSLFSLQLVALVVHTAFLFLCGEFGKR